MFGRRALFPFFTTPLLHRSTFFKPLIAIKTQNYCSTSPRQQFIWMSALKKIDVKSLSQVERQKLRERSKAIPLQADPHPLDIIVRPTRKIKISCN